MKCTTTLNKPPSKINGQQGWYDLIYTELLSNVQGYINAGMDKQRALEVAFDASCASKGIKHKIENLILSEGIIVKQ
jgi:hypothetical protein